jgi:acetyl esterase
MGDPVVVDGLTLDPEMQFLLELLARRDLPSITVLSPAEIRVRMRQEAALAAGAPEAVGSVADLMVEGAAGELPARLYTPEVAGPAPLLVFLHGGGFMFGDLESYDGVCRVLCRHGGMMVLAVEYRLAPEHPFPAPVEDARAALRWAFGHTDELGADSLRVAIGGDSAGGSLSAVVSQLAARDGGPAPALQVLIYPAIDPGHAYRSVELFADGFFLTRTEMDFFDEAYAGGIADDPADPRRYPLVGDLSGLATAYVVTAGFDPLRDEGEAYGAALEAAETPTLVRRYPSLIHGFINMIGISQASRNALVEIAEQVGVLLRGAGGGASETAAAAPTGRRQ